MKWLLLLLAALFAAAFVAQQLLDDPGYVLVGYGTLAIEMSLAVLVALVLGAFLVLYLVLRLASGTQRLPRTLGAWRGRRRAALARRGLTRGLLSLAEGEWDAAEKLLVRQAAGSETPLLHWLAAARAAQGRQAYAQRDQYLRLANASVPDAGIAVGLTQAELQLEERQLEEAESTLLQLRRQAPAHRQVLKLLLRLFLELRDWERLRGLLPDLRRRKVIPGDEYTLLELKVYGELLDAAAAGGDRERLARAWSNVPKDLRGEELLLLTYARHLVRFGLGTSAEPLLREALDRHVNERLVELYGLLEGDQPARQLEHAERWLASDARNPVLLQAVGRLAARSRLWGKARGAFEGSLEAQPSAVVFRELGQLHEETGDAEAATRCYREAARLAADEARQRAVGSPPGEPRLPVAVVADAHFAG